MTNYDATRQRVGETTEVLEFGLRSLTIPRTREIFTLMVLNRFLPEARP